MINFSNKVKEKLTNGDNVHGIFMMAGEPAFAEIMGYGGLDFVLVDTEHSSNTLQQVEHIFRAIEVSGATPFMRVTVNDRARILQALDSGARGIVIPQVNTAEQAQAAVTAARYSPSGERGVAGVVRAARYGFIPFHDYIEQANNNVMVLTQVEHVDAVANLDDILAVEGLDGIFIGPTDLSQSMGIVGQFANPELRETITWVIQQARKAKKVVGMFCLNAADARYWREQGANFITIGTDTMLIAGAVRKLVSDLKS